MEAHEIAAQMVFVVIATLVSLGGTVVLWYLMNTAKTQRTFAVCLIGTIIWMVVVYPLILFVGGAWILNTLN